MRIKQNEKLFIPLIEDGALSVDQEGRIWRHRFRECAIEPRRAEHAREDGYMVLCTGDSKARRTAFAHRIIWQHFNGAIPAGLTINHLNGIRDDNRPCNLEACTQRENIRHSIDVLGSQIALRPGERSPWAKLSLEQVGEIRARHAAGEFPRILSKEFGVSAMQIWRIAKRKSWRASA